MTGCDAAQTSFSGPNLILSPDVGWGCDLRRRVTDSVVDGTRAA